MAISVDIVVVDDQIVPAAVSGVVVGVYNSAGTTLVTTGTTNGSGIASFLLPGDTYEARFYKSGYKFSNAARFEVLEPLPDGSTNVFEHIAERVDFDTPSDPFVCRCTGKFVGLNNQPLSNVVLRVMAKIEAQTPKIVDGSSLVSAPVIEAHTDSDGYVSIDLLRGGEFYVTFGGEDDIVWDICVPDRSTVNLVDLIHPYPVVIDWDDTEAPGDAISLAVGETKTIPFSVLLSDFQYVTEDIEEWITVTSSNQSLELTLSDTGLTMRGLEAGISTVTAAMKEDILPKRLPVPSLQGPSLTVTITP